MEPAFGHGEGSGGRTYGLVQRTMNQSGHIGLQLFPRLQSIASHHNHRLYPLKHHQKTRNPHFRPKINPIVFFS